MHFNTPYCSKLIVVDDKIVVADAKSCFTEVKINDINILAGSNTDQNYINIDKLKLQKETTEAEKFVYYLQYPEVKSVDLMTNY